MIIPVARLLLAAVVAGCASAPASAPATPSPSASPSTAATAPPTPSPAPIPAPAFTISTVPVGGGPTPADVDGDGDIDLMLASSGVSVLLNDGNGNFGDPTSMDVLYGTGRIIATDFTGDGKVDLALSGDDNLAVFTGKGDGTFRQPPDYYPTANDLDPENGNAESMDAGDLDGDGDPDITIAYYGASGPVEDAPSHLAVFINDGAAGFEPAVYYDCIACIGVVLGDFDEDGATDAVSVQFNRLATLWRGASDGTLAPGTPFNTGGRSVVIIADDLNADGHLDLFIGNNHDFTVSVLLGAGDGTFGEALVMAAANTHSIAISDIDADGHLDLLSANDRFVHAWLGDGSGNFAVTQGIQVNEPDARAVSAADFNADGRADLAVSVGESTLAILIGRD